MELVWNMILLLVILGFLAGIVASIAGIGGGVFFVSFMTLLFGIPINMAIDTSNFIILITSLAGFITYYRQGRIHLKSTLIFSGFSILGSLACMVLFLVIVIENFVLKILFATSLIVIGIYMIFKAFKVMKQNKVKKDVKDAEHIDLKKQQNYKANLKKSVPWFFFGGFIGYLLGIGGGIIYTPVLNVILGYSIHVSTATSTGIIFFTAIYTVIAKMFFGQINYLIGLIIGIGSVIGSIIGAKISKKMPKTHLQFFVAIVLIVLAIRMYF